MEIVPNNRYALQNGQLVLDGCVAPIVFFQGYPDDPWFKAKPIHEFLGGTNVTQTLARVEPDDKASLKDLVERLGPPLGVVQNTTPPNHEDYNEGKAIYVNESGLYSIILGSRKPLAKPFKCWVTQEVLPSIRRTGGYSVQAGPQLLQSLSEQRQLALQKREGGGFPAVVQPNKRQRRSILALDEARLDWKKDLQVATDELQGVKAQFMALLHVAIQKQKLPNETLVGGLAARPPLRFREMALAAVSAYRLLFSDDLEGRVQQNSQSQDSATVAPQRSGRLDSSTDGRRQYDDAGEGEEEAPLPGEDGEADAEWREQLASALEEDLDEGDDILKVSEVMRAAGVCRAVWLSFRSDLSNKLLALKCEQTQGAFEERRPEAVGPGIPVSVHKYKKSQDWPLAWEAVQKTQHLYQKRVRECLEAFHHAAGIPLDPSIADLARRVAEALRTH